jgi:class 3 adenylate cyclase
MNSSKTSCDIVERVIAFLDLQGYHRLIATQLSEAELFNFFSDYYSLVSSLVDEGEGEIIKFLGDGILVIFPPSKISISINTLKTIKEKTDLFLKSQGFASVLCVKAGIGSVAYGELGKGKDIVGRAVNEVALLPDGEFVLSEALKEKIDS